MKLYQEELEIIASSILEQNAELGEKPNYTNRDFMNAILIFQNTLMDKMFDKQNSDNLSLKEMEDMADKCGNELRSFILKYTGLDTHNVEVFL